VIIPSYEKFCEAIDAYYSEKWGHMSSFIGVLEGEHLYQFRIYWINNRPSIGLPPQAQYQWYIETFTKLGMYLNQIEVDIEKDNQ
jgi:hypothetical protein